MHLRHELQTMCFRSFTVNKAPYVCLVFMIRDSYSVCKRRIQWTFLNRLRSNYSCKTAIILLLLMTCYMVVAIVKTVQHTSTIVSNDKFTTAMNPCFLKSFSKKEVRYFWVTLGTLIHFIRYRLQIKFQFSQRKCNMFCWVKSNTTVVVFLSECSCTVCFAVKELQTSTFHQSPHSFKASSLYFNACCQKRKPLIQRQGCRVIPEVIQCSQRQKFIFLN